MIRGSHGLPVPAGHFAPKSGSKELAVLRTNPILGSISGVALVGKFRSRIRILQFSTRKITPHGNVHISSARRPIVFWIFVFLLVRRNQSGHRTLSAPHPLSPPSKRPPGPFVYRVYYSPYHVGSWPCADRTPKPGLVTPGPSSPAGPGNRG